MGNRDAVEIEMNESCDREEAVGDVDKCTSDCGQSEVVCSKKPAIELALIPMK